MNINDEVFTCEWCDNHGEYYIEIPELNITQLLDCDCYKENV